MTPARSWSLLQPLAGTCLYVCYLLPLESTYSLNPFSQQHRQGWFTYSYCHNDEIRQFKEVIPSQARLTGKISFLSYFFSPLLF